MDIVFRFGKYWSEWRNSNTKALDTICMYSIKTYEFAAIYGLI